ncbi:PstS family phosphate ABC transporter substrate-binding protein, partial [Mycobacterium simiae]
MKFSRSGATVSLLLASALVVSACGGHPGTSSSTGSSTPTVPVNCGGKKKLLAAGSTAQKNAIEQFVYAYIHACPGHTLDYNANGSGAGMKLFLDNQVDLAGSDSPMDPAKGEPDKAAARCGSEAWDLPVVFGPIAVTYNINGV